MNVPEHLWQMSRDSEIISIYIFEFSVSFDVMSEERLELSRK